MTKPIAAPLETYDKQGMLKAIREQFKVSWHGIHGANHWARVLHHGITIGTERSADLLVIELFAFLHDSQRHSDGGGTAVRHENALHKRTPSRASDEALSSGGGHVLILGKRRHLYAHRGGGGSGNCSVRTGNLGVSGTVA